jgi:hypothetical protein
MLKIYYRLLAVFLYTYFQSSLFGVDGNYIRSDVTELGSAWTQNSWFGIFYDPGTNWIYHESFEWLYPIDNDAEATWLYHQDWKWLWVKKEYFPLIYFQELSTWLYFGDNSGTRSFYDYATESWIPLVAMSSKLPGIVVGKITLGIDSGILYYTSDTNAADGWRKVGEESIDAATTDTLFLQGDTSFERRARLVSANFARQLAGGGPEELTIGGQSLSTSISVEHDTDDDQMVVTANSIPNYTPTILGIDVSNGWNTGVTGGFESLKLSEENLGANGGNNPNQIATIEETYRIPLTPENNTNATDTSLGTVGMALNGIPVYNPFEDANETAAYGRIFSGCCGHPQISGAYHYHKYPTCLRLIKDIWKSEKEKCDELDALLVDGGHSPLLGFAVDGWPIYGPVGWRDNSNQTGVLLKSSYTGTNDSSGNPAYVEGSGDLDECNGLVSPTPEFPEGVYHYIMSIVADVDGAALRYLNPHFGYDVRNTLIKHSLMPVSWSEDSTYIAALKAGFTVNNVSISGTDNYSTFVEFIEGMQATLNTNGMSSVASEFETMQIAYPFTIRKYRGTPTDAGTQETGTGDGDGQLDATGGIVSVSPSSGIKDSTITVTIFLDANTQPPLPPINISPNSVQVGNVDLTSISRTDSTTITGSLNIASDSSSGSQNLTITFATPEGGTLEYLGIGLFTIE